MEKTFEILKQTRSNFLKLLEGLSLQQINQIPERISNNIAWNFGHIIVTQQLLCYKVNNIEPKISNEIIEKYKKGTKPEADISADELNELKQLSETCLNTAITDYKSGLFANYNQYPTSYGVELNSIEDAFKFLSVHEGLHLGYAMVINKLV